MRPPSPPSAQSVQTKKKPPGDFAISPLSARLNDVNRAVILEIKAACWHHPEYRRGFTSADVYEAVLDRGVRDVPGFWADLRERRGIEPHTDRKL